MRLVWSAFAGYLGLTLLWACGEDPVENEYRLITIDDCDDVVALVESLLGEDHPAELLSPVGSPDRPGVDCVFPHATDDDALVAVQVVSTPSDKTADEVVEIIWGDADHREIDRDGNLLVLARQLAGSERVRYSLYLGATERLAMSSLVDITIEGAAAGRPRDILDTAALETLRAFAELNP